MTMQACGHHLCSGLFAVGLALTALPLQAETTSFALPAGCEGVVTIQSRSCVVTHLFRCGTDPDGYLRRVEFGPEGLQFASVIDSETQWIESYSVSAGSTSRLDEGALDPANLTELLETGKDGFNFSTTSDAWGTIVHIGQDRLIGATEVIDGVELLVTEFEARAFDPGGALIYEVRGNEFVHPGWRSFIAGIRTVTNTDGAFETDERPVEFAFPGEPGFLSTKPLYDCELTLSMLETMQ